ncbi:MAG: homoserine kinase [Gammaproteobacteria bacterium]|nr:homoserine kinase [Gammaproteobacteria bacterium]
MSVYTSVTQSQLECFLSNYDVGSLVAFEGISAGIENTNYFVESSAGHYVLTLFEALSLSELPYFLNLMAFLNEHGIPCAHPIAAKDGYYSRELNNKPATLVQRLQGSSVEVTSVAHCQAIGAVLGKMHRVSEGFDGARNNSRGFQWRNTAAKTLLPLMFKKRCKKPCQDQGDSQVPEIENDMRVLEEELHRQSLYHFSDLPQGVIHADLFRDNALFSGENLTGVIDFYYACNDMLLYDVAVAVNDWCVQQDGSLDFYKAKQLLMNYHAERPLSAIERRAWPLMLRVAALRFWLSRLMDLYFPREGEITQSKDPVVFKYILLARMNEALQLDDVWPSAVY